jgi:molybdopterin/thiamine biosynthesis adenylyltransferase
MKKLVTIVGVGALGSHLTLFARNWDCSLRLIDFDKVEQRNLLAQFHGKMGLRRNKALSLQQSLRGLFGINLKIIPHELLDSNTDKLLGGSSLVIDCTDRIKSREIIQKYVRANGIPCLHGALSTDSFARIVWDECFVADEEGEAGQPTCEGGEQLPFFAFVASQVAIIAQKFLISGERYSVQITPDKIIRLA